MKDHLLRAHGLSENPRPNWSVGYLRSRVTLLSRRVKELEAEVLVQGSVIHDLNERLTILEGGDVPASADDLRELKDGLADARVERKKNEGIPI